MLQSKFRRMWAMILPALLLLSTSALANESDLIINSDIQNSSLLKWGMLVCVLGLAFGMVIYVQLKRMPVHKSMKDVSELIYETCKTYLFTQGRFILILWVLIAVVMGTYFGYVAYHKAAVGAVLWSPIVKKVAIILGFSVLGMAGSYCVAWFGIRVNTFANSRAAFASLRGKPFPTYAIPLKAGMSIGTLLISVELLMMLAILLFLPSEYQMSSFIGFAIGESLGASVLRIAGGIFTKIADIGADLMKIVFNIKEDDARNPGVVADCTGDNAGDSVGPSADGFETYGVTGVALIVFLALAIKNPAIQLNLLVWIFALRVVMIISSVASYLANEAVAKIRYGQADKMNFEAPLTSLVWLTSLVSIGLTYLVSYFLLGKGILPEGLWYKLASIISLGTLAGALIPEFIKVFTSTNSGHVREVVTASREGGASLNVLAGLTAGNFSAFWMGMVFVALMGGAYAISMTGLAALMPAASETAVLVANIAAPVFAFGLVAFGFLGMGPVTIGVDSYGPVTDNAQSVYELSTIETLPNIKAEIKKEFGFEPDFEKAKHHLEENDGAGNTFKATAKPVLIGTAVVGATTMIFSIIASLTGIFDVGALKEVVLEKLSHLALTSPPFLLGLISGGAVIYWFTGASTQAVSTGAYRAVEFIKANIKLDGAEKASTEDSKKVVEICTRYAQKGMINIFLTVFFLTLGFACVNPYFFIGYLISIALFGLYQALFMANAGGAWDNAKKLVEVELKEKGTPLHAATVVGDTVGDPFKDTSSVAMNPIIKFTTLFGLLAVELAHELRVQHSTLVSVTAAVLLAVGLFFVWRSFYGMRIKSDDKK